MKGSIEVVLDKCNTMYVDGKVKKIKKELLLEQNDFLASSGYRVIALAKKLEKDFVRQNSYDKLELNDLTFMGLVGFIDPIRKEVIDSIDKCKKAKIDVLMITGDHPLTAYGIAKELNIVKVFEEGIVCDKTPFYAVCGGQVGDSGTITKGNNKYAVIDTQMLPHNHLFWIVSSILLLPNCFQAFPVH